jgi:hypothetical protein
VTGELVMNPLVDIHVHPQPRSLPIDPGAIEVITVQCPVRERGLLVHELTPVEEPELFGFFAALVERCGEIDLDSDAPIVPALVRMGLLVHEQDIPDWPRFRIPFDMPTAGAAHRPGHGWVVAQSLLFQREFALHPGISWPPDYDQQEGLLRCFAGGPVVWTGGPALATPFWLEPQTAELVATLVPGRPVPPLPQPLAAALAAIGAIVGPDGEAAPRALEPLRAAFASDRHVVIEQLLDGRELSALRRYYGALLDAGLVRLGDRQNDRRFSSYNDPVGRFVHARLAGLMSAIVGLPVLPSFSFFVAYVDQAALAPHRDRPQAEYSISLQLDYLPDTAGATGWPLRFTADGQRCAADLRIGDAVFYHGRELTHERDRLPSGHRSSHLILEYVPDDFDGPLI